MHLLLHYSRFRYNIPVSIVAVLLIPVFKVDPSGRPFRRGQPCAGKLHHGRVLHDRSPAGLHRQDRYNAFQEHQLHDGNPIVTATKGQIPLRILERDHRLLFLKTNLGFSRKRNIPIHLRSLGEKPQSKNYHSAGSVENLILL